MKAAVLLALAVLLSSVPDPARAGTTFDPTQKERPLRTHPRGWGRREDITWTPWSRARQVASLNRKPIMLITYKRGDPASEFLRNHTFNHSVEVHIVSRRFVNVLVTDKDIAGEPEDTFWPEKQKYFPHILFLTPYGEVLPQVYNKNQKVGYWYAYFHPEELVPSMKWVLQLVRDAANVNAPPNPDGTPDVDTDAEDDYGEELKPREVWNHNVKWLWPFKMAKLIAQVTDKPIMFIIHKTYCKNSRKMREMLLDNAEFETLSEYFVMVKTEEDEEPHEAEYSPDGVYTPRIMFMSSSGVVQNDITNLVAPKGFGFYYFNAKEVVASMHKAALLLANDAQDLYPDL